MLGELTIAQARERIAAGELSPVALVQAALDRIAAVDGELNVFRSVFGERALAEAQLVEEAARRGDPLGPLAGIPVALKDNIEVAGVPMTAGTHYLDDGGARARRAGVGATARRAVRCWSASSTCRSGRSAATGQNVHYGPCRTRGIPSAMCGGSSGGSGAALAASMAHGRVGNRHRRVGADPRRAVRRLGAMRPSRGRVSNRGSVPVAWTFDAIGPMARRAEDVAQVLSGDRGIRPARIPPRSDVAGEDYVAALCRAALRGTARRRARRRLVRRTRTRPVVAAVRDAAATLARLGAVVEEVELPGRAEAFRATRGELLLAEAAWFHRERLAQYPGGVRSRRA